MGSMIGRVFRSALSRTGATAPFERLLAAAARAADIDLLSLAHRQMGILNFQNFENSGEAYLLRVVLAPLLRGRHAVVLDIGANVGGYSRLVRSALPDARIYAFEPNPEAFRLLSSNLTASGVTCVQRGMASTERSGSLFVYPDERTTGHASLYREMMTGFFGCAEPCEVPCSFTTVDAFCAGEGIDRLDLMKIDTEGHELEVIRGAREMLAGGRIDAVQFEFGEGHVYSRVFLRDFFDALPGYRFFRLCERRLLPLEAYDPRHEIFRFQNILAVSAGHALLGAEGLDRARGPAGPDPRSGRSVGQPVA